MCYERHSDVIGSRRSECLLLPSKGQYRTFITRGNDSQKCNQNLVSQDKLNEFVELMIGL